MAHRGFYIRSGWRGQRLMRTLLDGPLDLAAGQGAAIVEACPIDTERKLIWGEGYVGIASVFRDAGFAEMARRSPTRPLMRRVLRAKSRRRSVSKNLQQ